MARAAPRCAPRLRRRGTTWLADPRVEGGTEREKGLFYSSLYRSFLWPALRSDVNGEFTDVDGKVINPGFRYYTGPSYWDDSAQADPAGDVLVPDVAADVISSDTTAKRLVPPRYRSTKVMIVRKYIVNASKLVVFESDCNSGQSTRCIIPTIAVD